MEIPIKLMTLLKQRRSKGRLKRGYCKRMMGRYREGNRKLKRRVRTS